MTFTTRVSEPATRCPDCRHCRARLSCRSAVQIAAPRTIADRVPRLFVDRREISACPIIDYCPISLMERPASATRTAVDRRNRRQPGALGGPTCLRCGRTGRVNTGTRARLTLSQLTEPLVGAGRLAVLLAGSLPPRGCPIHRRVSANSLCRIQFWFALLSQDTCRHFACMA